MWYLNDEGFGCVSLTVQMLRQSTLILLILWVPFGLHSKVG